MAKFTHGTDFTGAGPFTGTQLNNLIDAATVLPGFITDWGATTPDVADSLLVYDTSAAVLAKCTLQNIIDAFPSDPAAGSKGLRTLGPGAQQACPGNDGRLGTSVTGVRLGNGFPNGDTAAAPKDMLFTPVNLAGGLAINWDLADVFIDTLTGSASKTYTFSNVRNGRIITIVFDASAWTGAAINWPTLKGAIPAATASSILIYTFVASGFPNPSGVVKAI